MDLNSILTISKVGAGSHVSRDSIKREGSSSFEVSNQHSAQIFMIPRWSTSQQSSVQDPAWTTPKLSPDKRKHKYLRSSRDATSTSHAKKSGKMLK